MSPSQGYHDHASRTAHFQQPPPLGTLSEELGFNQTISPRSELLSSPPTEGRRRTHASGTHENGSSRRRKHHHRRSSRKQGGSHDTGSSDTSQRELIRIVLEQEEEADNLKKALETTLQQLDEASQKVSEYERGTREAAERFKQVNDSRMIAEQTASTATQQLQLYRFQLANAQKEISTAQDTLKDLERQKDEAEDLAARARARARKLHQKQLVMAAKEEGRRAGFEAGIKQAQEELFITATARRAMAQSQEGSRRRPRASRTLEAPTPEAQSPVEEATHGEGPAQDSGPTDEQDSLTAFSEIETLKSPVKPRPHYLPPGNIVPPSTTASYEPRMQPSTSQPQPSTSQHPDRAYTPSVHPYRVDIPLPEQLPEGSKWVTAQEHREINGSQTESHTASLRTMPRPNQQPVPAPPQGIIVHPPLPRPMSTLPPVQQVFAVPLTTPFPPGHSPPKRSGSGSARKLLRFPTLAKNKAQSWYRSFSLRKKSRPVIDPIDEEPEQIPQMQQQQPPNGHADEQEGSETTRDLYRVQPEPPKSWYQVPRPVSGVKSQKAYGGANTTKGHSRATSMDEGRPDDRLSRASTRLSQLDMISSPPRGYQGGAASLSAQSNARKLAQKLSIIKEDPQSRGVTPIAEQSYASAVAPSMSSQVPPFALPPQSDTSRSRKRPPQIAVPHPPGFDPNNPYVQGNYHLFPNGAPNPLPPPPVPSGPSITPSSKRSEDIGIDVQPATATYDIPQTTAPPFTGNHLTPNYVWQHATNPLRTPRRDPIPGNWDQASHKSSQSKGGSHRATQSVDERPRQQPSESRSMRSGHSRSGSAMLHAPIYHPEPIQGLGEPSHLRPPSRVTTKGREIINLDDPRPLSVRSSGSNKNQHHARREGSVAGSSVRGGAAPSQTAPGLTMHRNSSRTSVHSHYDPNTYVDPAFYAPDGSVVPQTLQVPGATSPNMGRRSRSSSLEYVDP